MSEHSFSVPVEVPIPVGKEDQMLDVMADLQWKKRATGVMANRGPDGAETTDLFHLTLEPDDVEIHSIEGFDHPPDWLSDYCKQYILDHQDKYQHTQPT